MTMNDKYNMNDSPVIRVEAFFFGAVTLVASTVFGVSFLNKFVNEVGIFFSSIVVADNVNIKKKIIIQKIFNKCCIV